MTSTDLSPTPPSFRRRARLWVERHAISFYAATLTFLLALLAVAPAVFIEVPAGHVGVLWLRFMGGTVTDRVYGEGLRMIFPWDVMAVYDVRLRNETRRYEAVSANGMAMTVEVAVRYRINPPAAGLVHKLAGPSYAEILVHPQMASLIYEFVSKGNPEDFYSFNRGEIQDFLLKRAREQFPSPNEENEIHADHLRASMILIDDVMVNGITLPPLVRLAVDRKIEQQQIMQEYDFRVAREAKERDRKRIEAEGIRDFQEIVARNITPEYLRLRGVEATRAFADSPNAKTIIIGGRDGLPVILNTGDDARTAPVGVPTPAAPPAPAAAVMPPSTDPGQTPPSSTAPLPPL